MGGSGGQGRRIPKPPYQRKDELMNWDQVEGNWNQMKGRIREQWGELTDDEVAKVAGRRDELAGIIQERYGIAREEAHRQIDEWLDTYR